MGEISDMHVEAFEAGLDPTEMDGADWVDFYGGDSHQPLTNSDEDATEMIAHDFKSYICPVILERAEDGEQFADTISRIFPQLSKGQALGFEHFLMAINSIPDAED